MTLIDRDAVLKMIPSEEMVARMAVMSAPTVDAQPVRHGHWVGVDDEPCEVWECDMCGYIYEGDFVYNYCPHCGAKMDGEQHDHTD